MTDSQPTGMDIAPDVLDTIVALALNDVDGVASVGGAPSKIRSLFSKSEQQGVSVTQNEDDTVDVNVVLTVLDGHSLNTIAAEVRKVIADAILSQAGYTVNRVDVHVDGILFQD